MPKTIEKIRRESFPLFLLKGLVAFPGMSVSMDLTDPAWIAPIEDAYDRGLNLLLVAQRDPSQEEIKLKKEIFRTGTIVAIKSFMKIDDDYARVQIEGVCRGKIHSVDFEAKRCEVMIKTIATDISASPRSRKAIREAMAGFRRFVQEFPRFSHEYIAAVGRISAPGTLADSLAHSILSDYEEKQSVLDELDPIKRLELVTRLVEEETELQLQDAEIHRQTRERIDQNQRDYYMREQIKVLKEELGDDTEEELGEYTAKILFLDAADHVKEKLMKEVNKLSRMAPHSADASVSRGYLDTALEVPWNKFTTDNTSISDVRKILDRDHDGMTKVKERVLEYVATKQLSAGLGNQILCLVGPPGAGKTSIASSLAEALGRKYVRVCLGGVRDESDIRGHRRTYVASMPGRIITALINSEVSNPLILLDEVDKMGNDHRGDPTSALLEVLDGEQNKAFRDHFLEIPVDLSDCIFVATANAVDQIPRPLLDRMEIIKLEGYARHEKFSIGKKYLLPKQIKRHGLTKTKLKVTDSALYEVVDHYTHESGVRNLERQLSALCRKAAVRIAEHGQTAVRVTPSEVEDMLGARLVLPTPPPHDQVGVANGLAYTEVGGEMLPVEAVAMSGSGKVELTGSLGAVMKESAHIALSIIRKNHAAFGAEGDFHKKRDIHIHFPEGAVPKDGPSAGVALVCAIASELSARPVRGDIAMTGEVTLSGKVLAIGGLKEKIGAAHRAGVMTVILPEENRAAVSELDAAITQGMEFIFCTNVTQVVQAALFPLGKQPKGEQPVPKGAFPPVHQVPTEVTTRL